jgi:glycosyltransferase involved in cell wall biosynthesis
MKVTVIIPTFNRVSFIESALTSVVQQSYDDIEIVVIDDGSTDDTGVIVEKIREKTSRPVHYRYTRNKGCASARNLGLEMSTGAAIAFLDSDDQWLPDACMSLAEKMLKSGKDFVYSPSVEVYETRPEQINFPVAADRPEHFAIEHFKQTNARNGSVLFRRHVFDRVGGFDVALRHNEDSDFLQRVAVEFEAAYSEVPTVRVFHHGGSKSKNRIGIYRALLSSSERTLRDNPEFSKDLGVAADIRISELRLRLLKALVAGGQLKQAMEVLRAIRHSGNWRLVLGQLFRMSGSYLKLRSRGLRFPRVPGIFLA